MQLEPNPEPEIQSHQSEPANDMESLLEEHLEEQDACVGRRGDIREGTVIEITNNGALIDVGLKREGFVPSRDLEQLERERMGTIEAGETVPVMIVGSQETEGYLEVSVYRARMEEDWLTAERLLKSGDIYEAAVSGHNRGGLTVQFGRIRGFIPLSHVVGLPRGMRDPDRRERLASMVGQTIGLRVIEVDRQRRRLILSQRQAHRGWQRLRKRQLLEELVEGQVRQGVVASITGFGAFVDLGGIDGLVHISELAWHRVDDPRDVVKVGDQVEVMVLDIDQARQRIGLSLKQTQGDPWEQVATKYEINQLIEGHVTRVTDIGAFVEIEPGVEGLLHVSELMGSPSVTPQDVLNDGDTVLVKILRVEPERHRIGLSARRVRREEWEEWAAEQAVQTQQAEEATADITPPEPIAEPSETEMESPTMAGDQVDEGLEDVAPATDESTAVETVIPAESTDLGIVEDMETETSSMETEASSTATG